MQLIKIYEAITNAALQIVASLYLFTTFIYL